MTLRAPIVAAYGMGTNSTALLIEMARRGEPVDAILSADPEGERPWTYEFRELFSAWLVARGYPPITVVKKGGRPESLEENCLRLAMLPSLAYGFKGCSHKYKIEPQEAWANKWPPARAAWAGGQKVVKLIGYDVDEPHRAAIPEDDKYTYRYPLLEWGWGREECVAAIAASTTGQGAFAVADPRPTGVRHNNVFRVVGMDQHAGTVTSGHGPSSGGQAVADPRYHNWHPGASSRKLNVVPWAGTAGTVTGSQQVASGALSIADPRALHRSKGDNYLTGGHYGVVAFDQPAGAVSASARYDNGRWSVADPRMPAADERLTCIIQSLDGTWHRPFTTLELAALQSLVDPEEQLELDGLSDSDWRERIGNAVPPAAAEAIAHVMGTTLLLARAGETFMLSSMPIWVRPVAVGLSVAQQELPR